MIAKKQVFNPYLPSFEYVPDGEPHVFDGRVYLYGSHDRFDGAEFCLNDYVSWSAPVDDLTDWRYEGVILKKEQDPRNQNIPENVKEPKPCFGVPVRRKNSLNKAGIHAQWAPDVTKGKDGRYYLYYCLDYLPEIAVAVCDQPAGEYSFLGFVKHADGTALGSAEGDFLQFDPGIFMDDDGTIYLYSGNAPMRREEMDNPGSEKQGSQVMVLEDDMLTLRKEPTRLMPDIRNSEGTEYEGHEFFEASSIRHINGKYYFIYSSVRSHELCYAVSDRPDRDFEFCGTLVDIGDVFLNGRTDQEAVMALGNTHGGIECCNGQWYVFYHRQTNRTLFSRQACAEKIFLKDDGRFEQAEVTSCGLNKNALSGEGIYPARICCHLTRYGKNVMSNPMLFLMDYPFLTQDCDDLIPTAENIEADEKLPVQYVANMRDESAVGFKYFEFDGNKKDILLKIRECSYQPGKEITKEQLEAYAWMQNQDFSELDLKKTELDMKKKLDVTCLPHPKGEILVSTVPYPEPDKICGCLPVDKLSEDWTELSGSIQVPEGTQPLYFTYRGQGSIDFCQINIMK
ncbi:MAG TPA: family 43 glycosylhydrolase [Lachnospiraceae bacterium]|nr:family 43 glycosylhydrolase [Lachnospiraceae bacterium]